MEVLRPGLLVSVIYRLCQYPLYSETEPPKALAPHFEPGQLLDSTMLQYGFYAWSWSSAGRLLAKLGYGPEYEILQSIFFVFILYFLSSVPTLPLSVLLFVADLLKGWAVAIVLGSPFLAAFLYIFKWAGVQFVPWLMAFMISFQLIMVVIYPTVIQPLFNKLSPLPESDLRSRIESLATKLKFPLSTCGSKRSSHSNAYFHGKHIVIFDILVQQSKPEGVEAVLAHELGHWFLLYPTKTMAISQVTILALFPAFLRPLLRTFDFPKAMILTPFEAVVSIAMNAVSRHFEWQADQFACELQDRITFHVKNLSTVWVDWLYSTYHHSHPTLTERLKALPSCSREKEGLGV
ncbi:hypothetical protein M378DRAFT_186944 [Amanita muscaria Koide BX008]|uniref:CAAX prenyl protease n=1 Tax=Amanita muscaria (strain Koide BX008) TaxID=946122 RepID=A0A0C2X3E6_AMAMK|nr:hypothetical protein M378DRAFT_186944 [Amanita muscaria Koide BX008]